MELKGGIMVTCTEKLLTDRVQVTFICVSVDF